MGRVSVALPENSPPQGDTPQQRAQPFAHVLHGLLMGAADSVPGVSGGTMALIVGIYERLLRSIGTGFRAILTVLRLDFRGAVEHLKRVEWALVLPLGAGIGTALVVAAEIIPGLLEQYPAQMRGLFLGMVGASIAIPWKRVERHTAALTSFALLAAVAAFVFSGLPALGAAEPTPLRTLLSASVAICAMILPGVSGAFLLEVLGMYEPTLEAIHARDLMYVATFAVGATFGLGSFALLLSRMLQRMHDPTMMVLVGLMLGSLRALWPWQTEDRTLMWAPDTSTLGIVGVITVAGFVFVWAIERWGSRRGATD